MATYSAPTVNDLFAFAGLQYAATDSAEYQLALDAASDYVFQVTTVDATTSPFPARVHTAILLLALRLYNRKSSPEGVSGFGFDGIAVRFSAQDPDVDQLLSGYRARYKAIA